MTKTNTGDALGWIAVIGMAGRFPGAETLASFWENLCQGRESITRFKPMAEAGRHSEETVDGEQVGAAAILEGVELFDATFFGFSPAEAEIMDPQHRLGLECAWEAMEHAGYDGQNYEGSVGVFTGTSLSTYLLKHLLPREDLLRLNGGLRLLLHNDKDTLPSTISYKLGITGPSVSIGSACSSSLAAVHFACQSLLTFQCDMALAGGVAIHLPQDQGHLSQAGGIYSNDGFCRAFDAKASGTVGGSGLGMVVLKRYREAVRDGDFVHGIIRATAVNNDGAARVGYSAPSVRGQATVIEEAQAMADVDPATISLVEAHGTGTILGDPIEVEALTRAFGRGTRKRQYCALTSVKTNIGHLDAAAGIAGFIKTLMALKHAAIPPSLHFERPNPNIDFKATPFYVNTSLKPWVASDHHPRRAGVSSFGMGGTNVHLIVEEAPSRPRAPSDRPSQLLLLSAKSEGALAETTKRLVQHFQDHPQQPSADSAFTLAVGRRAFAHRRFLICRNGEELAQTVDRQTTSGTRCVQGPGPMLLFMFPGQGIAYGEMARDLYRVEPAFRNAFDRCAEILLNIGGPSLAPLMNQANGSWRDAERQFRENGMVQPAIFSLEYALAQWWAFLGIKPKAMIGHSLGEYVAACLAGVFSLEAALRILLVRGKLTAQCAPGAMLVVHLSKRELDPLMGAGISIAAANGPRCFTLAGSRENIQNLMAQLEVRGVTHHRLPVNTAFHSPAMDPILDRFSQELEQLWLQPPKIPFVSNVTGQWISAEEATSPRYWVRHLRETVRFGPGLELLLQKPGALLLEVGPGQTLTHLARDHAVEKDRVLASLPHTREQGSPVEALMSTLGRLWLRGVTVDWPAFYDHESRARVPLPGVFFERKRYWIPAAARFQQRLNPTKKGLLDLWLHRYAEESEQGEKPVRGIEAYPGLRNGLNHYCRLLIYDYWAEQGILRVPGQLCSPDEIRVKLKLLPIFQRFFEFMVTLLEQGEFIRRHDGSIQFLRAHEPVAADHFKRDLDRRFPGFRGLCEFLTHCARAYGRALSAPGAALGVLYPGGSGHLMKRLLAQETVSHDRTGLHIGAIGDLIRSAALRHQRPLNILEVGMGGGLLTWELLPQLEGHHYCGSDIGKGFVQHAREQAQKRAIPHAEFRVLDISKDPRQQGFALNSFDLVLGLNVVHATRQIRPSLRHLHDLLAPSGILALIETIRDEPWITMTSGLAEGWWLFEDDLRTDSPLIDLDSWEGALSTLGFKRRATLPKESDKRQSWDSGLILAQKADAPKEPEANPLALPEKQGDMADWFYAPSWRRLPQTTLSADISGGWLVFGDAMGLAEALAERLTNLGTAPILVRPGTDYVQHSPLSYDIDPNFGQHYSRLIGELKAGAGVPKNIVHLWTVSDYEDNHGREPEWRLSRLEHFQTLGIHALLALVQALGKEGIDQKTRLTAVTTNLWEVLGSENGQPEKSTLLGAIKIIPREYPNIRCRALDFTLPEGVDTVPEEWHQSLWNELFSSPDMLALRGRFRWAPHFEAIRLPSAPQPHPRLREGGVYLIAGGTGGMGLCLAEHLVTTCKARLILTHRREFPPRDRWQDWREAHGPDDPTSRKIETFTALERRGGHIMLRRADIADLGQMKALIRSALERFGHIHGAIHCAGNPDRAGIIHRRNRAQTEKALSAKVRGAVILEAVLRDCRLDFLVFSSSIGSLLYHLKFGEVGYVAANDFLNAFSLAAAARGAPTTTIDWTDWKEAGMWADAQKRLVDQYDLRDDPAKPRPSETSSERPQPALLLQDLLRGLSNREGIDVFERILAQTLPQVIVSTQNFEQLLEHHRGFTTGGHRNFLERSNLAKATHERPRLNCDYRSPQTPVQKRLVRIWEKLLGIQGLGIDDDFFDLGGDSLLALRVLSHLQEEWRIQSSLAHLFETPTVALLAERIEILLWAREGESGESNEKERDEVFL